MQKISWRRYRLDALDGLRCRRAAINGVEAEVVEMDYHEGCGWVWSVVVPLDPDRVPRESGIAATEEQAMAEAVSAADRCVSAHERAMLIAAKPRP